MATNPKIERQGALIERQTPNVEFYAMNDEQIIAALNLKQKRRTPVEPAEMLETWEFRCYTGEVRCPTNKAVRMRITSAIVIATIPFLGAGRFSSAQDALSNQFTVSSTTFEDGGTLPLSAIYNYPVNGSNSCSLTGAPGLDQSPELAWKHAPSGTHSFVVTTFDVTAGVTHWGMYNIPASVTALPENAGVTGSTYGPQVVNVFGDLSYDGPCPPANYPPNVHRYVFTVYALDTNLNLPSSANFPATALTLYRELLAAGSAGHILASASITGLYSTTPAAE